MLKTVAKFFNDNHWYIIAGAMVFASILWAYGCESKTISLLDAKRKVGRMELQNELNYEVGLAKARIADLDKQDAVKQSLLDAANIMNNTGTINASGLLNLAASIGGISYGLTQRQKRISADKTNAAAAA
jgi:hypothetical protein